MTKHRTLIVRVYAPALVGNDCRTLDIVHGMEKALPGLRLEWRVTGGRRLAALPQRDAWLLEKLKDGGFPLVCNGDESYPVTMTGGGISGLFSPGGQPQFEVYAKLPLDEPVIAAAAAVLEGGQPPAWGRRPLQRGCCLIRDVHRSVVWRRVPPERSCAFRHTPQHLRRCYDNRLIQR